MTVCTKHCEGCPLQGRENINDGMGDLTSARFLVVTGAPAPRDNGKLMSQSAMTLFGKIMGQEQFQRDEFYFQPSVRCQYDPDLFSTKEKTLIAKTCRPYLLEKIHTLRKTLKVILPLGADASKAVLSRAVKITQVRGMPVREEAIGDAVILPMLNPMMAVLYPQHESTIRSDAATLGRLVDNGYDVEQSSAAAMGNYELIDDLQFLVDQSPMIVSYDTENTGLRWYAPDAQILTMQFSIRPGEAFLLPWDHPDMPQSNRAKARLRRQLNQLLNRPGVVVVGQNAKYDAVYTAACAGVRYKIGGCTLNMAARIDENALTKNLDDLTKRYVPEMAGYADGFNATVDKSRMIELPLDDNFINYGCGDADAVMRLYPILLDLLSADERLLNCYNTVTLPGLNTFVSVELRGLHVDEGEVESFEAFMIDKVAEAERALLEQVPKSIKRAHVEKGIKFSRADFVLDILFRHPDGFKLKPKVFTKTTAKLEAKRRVPSTSSKDHLPYFFEDCPFTFELSEFVKMSRVLTTNVQGFKSKYIVDGMVRPVYNMHVTVTARTSSEDPNGQNFPKRGPLATAYRKIFVAPPGYVFLEADLSQAELRIAACMANDREMLKIYRNKGDIHKATALIALEITLEAFERLPPKAQKEARSKAKAINFGFLYGMGWRGFIAYAKTQYGVEFTEKEAQRIRGAFFDRYAQLSQWHGQMRAHAHNHGYVRSFSGCVRHLPMIDSPDDGVRAEAERQAINSPVQEFGSSYGVVAASRIDAEIDPQYLQLVGFVHDAIYAYVKLEHVEWGAKTLKTYMQTVDVEGLFGIKMKCEMVADVGFGTSLGTIYEMGEIDLQEDGEIVVGDYDFEKTLVDEESDLYIPEQEIPPNGGRLWVLKDYAAIRTIGMRTKESTAGATP